jgi:hypothetical protein
MQHLTKRSKTFFYSMSRSIALSFKREKKITSSVIEKNAMAMLTLPLLAYIDLLAKGQVSSL